MRNGMKIFAFIMFIVGGIVWTMAMFRSDYPLLWIPTALLFGTVLTYLIKKQLTKTK